VNCILDLIKIKSEEYGDKTLLKDADRAVSYREFYQSIISTCGLIQEEQPGFSNRAFSIIAPNSAAYLSLLFALQKMGNMAVNLNPALTKSEMISRLNLAGVELLVTTKILFKDLKEIIGETKISVVILFNPGETALEFIRFAKQDGRASAIPNGAFLQFTGGTTGTTKAAVITHQNALANVDQLCRHFENSISLENQQVIIAFPFYHIFGVVFNFLFFLNRGGECLLLTDLRNTDDIIDLFRKNKITFTVAVNSWYKRLMAHEKFAALDLSSVKCSLAGGEYVPVTTKAAWTKATGKPLYSAYGLTETSALAIVSPADETNIDDSLGIAIPDTQVTLLDDNNNEILEDNTLGEIALKGPQVTTMYFNNPAETANAFVDGWFKTGDTAIRTQRRFYKYIDRKKDMISVSGNKVYPSEVEEVISAMEKILDVGVVAKNSERSGEEVAACIVVRPGFELTDEEIMNYSKEYLAKFKVPKHIFRFHELPKSPIGKTLRRTLKTLINS
jgi:long-chain acyl-CoA synthetase